MLPRPVDVEAGPSDRKDAKRKKAKEINVREEVWQRDSDLYGKMKEQAQTVGLNVS